MAGLISLSTDIKGGNVSQNTIIKDRNNPVVIDFTGVDLSLFTDISVHFGADERTLQLNPTSVIVNSPTELELNFQDTTETNANYWCISGFDAVNTNGIELTSKSLRNLPITPIIQGC